MRQLPEPTATHPSPTCVAGARPSRPTLARRLSSLGLPQLVEAADYVPCCVDHRCIYIDVSGARCLLSSVGVGKLSRACSVSADKAPPGRQPTSRTGIRAQRALAKSGPNLRAEWMTMYGFVVNKEATPLWLPNPRPSGGMKPRDRRPGQSSRSTI